ncbi:lupeol synthase-like [Quercus suber]|uniref:lupeol synthase-like n=1 Tax=Quercus suber TaxID=58331 RepID=UPI0032DEF649
MWKLKIAEGGPDLVSLNNFIGRQHWEFDPDAGTPEERAEVERMREEFKKNRFHKKQSADLLMRMQLRKENPCGPMPPPVQVKETEEITEEAVITTLKRALSFFSSIQAHDGHWPAESAGPLFFLQPMVMALYITGGLHAMLSPAHQKEIIRYLYNHQNEDGGWGFHIEGHSTMFGTALSYIALRLLGEGPEDGEDMAMARGRKWILDHGSLVAIPSWGKFWVTVLGVYEWSGCNPLPPEFWILPNFFPMHPGKMLCYGRLVYMPMSYLYGKRFVGPITGLIQSIRQELYNEPYHQINWNKARSTIAKEDLYYPHPLMQDMLWDFLHHVAEPILTRWPFSMLREKAVKAAIGHVRYEDENTKYLCIGSVEKVLCLLARWVEDPNSEAYKLHLARLPDNYWVAEDGLKVQSFGCQMWDAGFAIQAILSCNLNEEYGSTLRKSHEFVKASQIRENPSGDFKAMYRHISKGAWTFSMQDHGWQVSDCTAEGLKVALLFSQMSQCNLVQTAWALLSLIDAGQAEIDPTPIHRGVRVLINAQMEDGDFPQQEITGVFMRNCTLNYSSYRNIFPIWALAEYRRRVLFA